MVRGEAKQELCIVSLAGDDADICTDQITRIDVDHIAWSPDSTKIAATEDSARYMVDSDIWLFDGMTGEVRNLTDDAYAGSIPLGDKKAGVPDPLPLDVSPIFTPGGEAIIFARSSGARQWQGVPVCTGSISLAASRGRSPSWAIFVRRLVRRGLGR